MLAVMDTFEGFHCTMSPVKMNRILCNLMFDQQFYLPSQYNLSIAHEKY